MLLTLIFVSAIHTFTQRVRPGLETSVITTLLYTARWYRRPLWVSVILLAVHYILWGWYMWPDITVRLLLMRGFRWAALLCPASALLWLLYTQRNQTRDANAVGH